MHYAAERRIGKFVSLKNRRRARRAARVAAMLAVASVAAAGAWIAWPLPAGTAAEAPVPRLVLEDRGGLPLRATRAQDG
ncbi:MAG TPA: hypothetical protein VGB15_10480, partial [Longimicrobium sp.]